MVGEYPSRNSPANISEPDLSVNFSIPEQGNHIFYHLTDMCESALIMQMLLQVMGVSGEWTTCKAFLVHGSNQVGCVLC